MNFEAMQSTALKNNLQHPTPNYRAGNFNNFHNTNNFGLTTDGNNFFGTPPNGLLNQNVQQSVSYQFNDNQQTLNMNIIQQNNIIQSQHASPNGHLPPYPNNVNSFQSQPQFIPQIERMPSFNNNSPMSQFQYGQEPSYFNNNSPPSLSHQASSDCNPAKKIKINLKNAYIKIVEQPSKKPVRFRYAVEGRSAEHILGEFSTEDRKSYPKVQVCNYKGVIKLVASCITAEEPYRVHPHKLTGKNCDESGLCKVKLTGENMQYEFINLGIQCMKKQDVAASIKARELENVDPFKHGFNHDPNTINLNSIRLCVQAFAKNSDGKYEPLKPVFTNQIFDVKAKSELRICRICSCSSVVDGGRVIMLTCEKVNKENIKVRFFEERNGITLWEDYGLFEHTDVHKQTAIAFKTPPYHNKSILSPVTVNIQLLRPTDNVTSEPVPFDYIPNPAVLQRFKSNETNEIFQLLNDLQYDQINPPAATQRQYDSIDELVANTIPKVEALSPTVEQSIQNELWNFPTTSNNTNFNPNANNSPYQNQIYQAGNMVMHNSNASTTNNFNFPNQTLNNHNNDYDLIMENNSADLSSLSLKG